MTDHGQAAQYDVQHEKETLVLDFVLRRGSQQMRPPVRGRGELVYMETEGTDVVQDVKVTNWDEGAKVIATALAEKTKSQHTESSALDIAGDEPANTSLDDHQPNGKSPSSDSEHDEAENSGRPLEDDPQSAVHVPEDFPSATAGKKPKRGRRPKADYDTIQREAALAAEWAQARDNDIYKVDFAKEKGMTLASFDLLLDRVAARKRRSDK